MKQEKLDEWWAGLTVSQKERIASKIVSAKAGVEMSCEYPNCSNLWNASKLEEKQHIYEHCVDKHGYLLPEYKEGHSMSY